MAKEKYNHVAIEKAAQESWYEQNLYQTDLEDTEKDPYFLLFEFPYPSGDLHIGHWYAYALTDIYARMLRMQGKNVLFPMGFDSFGLPTENAAIKNNVDPREWTKQNIEHMRAQVRSMGTSIDWSKEVVSSEPEYYRWTQWLFAKLFEHGLAERRLAPVKWCPKDQTVLANEQVIDGKCERCDTPVEEKNLTQWFLTITKYAKRLLEDLDPLPWREDIKDAQRAWIGESQGAKLSFALANRTETIEVFTTRPDTLFGATYVVLAPEHPLVTALMPELTNAAEVEKYVKQTAQKSERERSENKQKTGVQLEGVMAINPGTKKEIPVYLADYVLASYGTGAVMAVPAHDERDFEFAQKKQLPVTYVLDPVTGDEQDNPKHKDKIVAVVEHKGKILTIHWPKELGGRLLVGGTVNPEEDPAVTAQREITEETGYTDLELIERAEEMVHHSYFAFSKNQATLAHTTILHFRLKSDAHVAPALEADEVGKFEVEWVTPETARKEIHDDQHQYALSRFIMKECYTGNGLLRNSGSFDGRDNQEAMKDIVAFAGGEMVTNYRIRDWLVSRQRYWGCPIPIVYDPEGAAHAVPPEHLPWLLPTDVTSGTRPDGRSPLAGSKELQERVVRLFGEGWTPEYDTLDVFVDSAWYFARYLSPANDHAFSDAALMKKWLPVNRYSGGSEHTTVHLLYARFFYKALYDLALVPSSEPFIERFNRGIILGTDGQKMSKRWGNIVNPDEMVAKYGADAVRMYLAFIGPYNEAGNYPWNLDGVEAMRRFLDRVYMLREKVGEGELTEEIASALHKASNKVGGDTERFKLNTAVSTLMVLTRTLEGLPLVPRSAFETLLILLAPYAPHLSEHLWQEMGGVGSVHLAAWPERKEISEALVTIGVQVNGRTRGQITLSPEAGEEEALSLARAVPSIEGALGGHPERIIYVPGRILNLVTGAVPEG